MNGTGEEESWTRGQFFKRFTHKVYGSTKSMLKEIYCL